MLDTVWRTPNNQRGSHSSVIWVKPSTEYMYFRSPRCSLSDQAEQTLLGKDFPEQAICYTIVSGFGFRYEVRPNPSGVALLG